jgi:CO/xanthine dehydrogenase Mo-binding subunit
MTNLNVVGNSIPRLDSIEKVTGRAIYCTDLKIPGMLYGKVLRSTYSHARILRIDTSKAERIRGVKVVTTGKDFPITHGSAWIKDQPFLAVDKVRYIGEPVAGVAALDENTAEEAVNMIEVEYEELPAVFDPLEAMEPGAPLIHEDLHTYPHAHVFRPLKGTNICNHFKFRAGDMEKGFSQSDYIIEDNVSIPMVQHCCLEPHGAIAVADPFGKITIWSTTCSPYVTRSELARALEIPMSRIRIISTWVGGGFGSKQGPRVECYCIALSKKANGKPVKIVFNREEEFQFSLVRQPCVIKVKSGFNKDGRIIAREVRAVWDTGAYSSHSPAVSRNAGFSAAGPYLIPNIKIDSYCVYTNKPISGPMRGFGIPEVTWAIEGHMDNIAEKLGMDPLELRLLNAVEEGSVYASGEVLNSVGLKETLLKVAEGIGWHNRRNKKVKNRGIGIACMHKSTGTPSSSSVLVKVNEDGTVNVLTSANEIGQGVNTVLAQIVAEELGISLDQITVSRPDTDFTPFERSTSSSRNTFHTGNAAKLAAADAKEQIFMIAAEALEASPTELEAKEGKIYVKGSKDRNILFNRLWTAGIYSRQQFPILGRGTFTTADIYDPLNPETGLSKRPTVFWMYGSQAAEVEVDPETGHVKVLKIVAAHDVGKAINPLCCQQQIEGAVVMGTSIGLMEELKVEKGKILNPSFTDYKLLTACDIPDIEPIIVETIHEYGPFGAKGLGEPAFAPTASAIANAVSDAIGVKITDLPITPEKILKALKAKKSSKQ